MKYILLIILSLSFLTLRNTPNTNHKKYVKFNHSKAHFSITTYKVYNSLITGNKSKLPKSFHKALNQFGLTHLFTPSGLHLSSLFFLYFLPRLFIFIILIGLLLFIIRLQAYLSLERVIIFKLLLICSRQFKWKMSYFSIFLLTICIALLSGNYSQSPMSFFFSILFWGTVLTFKNNKLKLILFLNLSLHICASIFNFKVSILSIIINPLYTFIISFKYPLIFLNHLIGGIEFIDKYIHHFLSFIYESLILINKLDQLPSIQFSFLMLLLVSVLFFYNYKKIAVLIICLHITPINMKMSKLNHKKEIINLGFQQEVIKNKADRIIYIDQECRRKSFSLTCKKRPSHLGGPQI